MGGPSADTMSGPLSPYSALTVAEMIVRGWKVRGHCAKCGTTLAISLDALARANGTDLILWGRTVPCPKIHENKWRCDGRLDYLAQQIRGGSWGRLKPISDRDIATIRASRGNHSRPYVKDRESPADG